MIGINISIGIDRKIRKPHAVTQGNSALTVDGKGLPRHRAGARISRIVFKE
jgi:hypothetical protein